MFGPVRMTSCSVAASSERSLGTNRSDASEPFDDRVTAAGDAQDGLVGQRRPDVPVPLAASAKHARTSISASARALRRIAALSAAVFARTSSNRASSRGRELGLALRSVSSNSLSSGVT
jgi:hypothetical protein